MRLMSSQSAYSDAQELFGEGFVAGDLVPNRPLGPAKLDFHAFFQQSGFVGYVRSCQRLCFSDLEAQPSIRDNSLIRGQQYVLQKPSHLLNHGLFIAGFRRFQGKYCGTVISFIGKTACITLLERISKQIQHVTSESPVVTFIPVTERCVRMDRKFELYLPKITESEGPPHQEEAEI